MLRFCTKTLAQRPSRRQWMPTARIRMHLSDVHGIPASQHNYASKLNPHEFDFVAETHSQLAMTKNMCWTPLAHPSAAQGMTQISQCTAKFVDCSCMPADAAKVNAEAARVPLVLSIRHRDGKRNAANTLRTCLSALILFWTFFNLCCFREILLL